MKSLYSIITSGPLLALPILLISAYFYSKVSGKSAPYRADIEAHRAIGTSRGFWYQLWILFITPLMFFYNLVADAIWFVTEIFHFTVHLFSIVFGWFKWIWMELLWPGLNFFWQIFIYYFWEWPWRHIQLVFSNLKLVATSTYLLAGMIGTGSALILIHIGRWCDYLLNNSVPLVMMVSAALATSLLAFGSGIISSMLRTNSKKGGWATVKANIPNGKKSAVFLLTYAVLSIILVVLEWIIWRAGWIHQWGNIIGGILSGPALLMSIISILNVIIIGFATSLGSHFMLDNSNDVKNNSFPFIMLALRNMGSIIYTLPWTMINVLILSIVPLIIFVGALKFTQQITSFVRSGQENSNISYLDARKWTDTLNIEKCSDSTFTNYLNTIKDKDSKSKDFVRQLNWGNQVRKMTGVKNTFLDFTPVQNCWKYDSTISNLKLKLADIQKDSSAMLSAMKKDNDSLSAQKARAEVEYQRLQFLYSNFKAKESDSLLAIKWAADSTIEAQYKYASEEKFNEMLKTLSERITRLSAGPEMQKRQIKIISNQIECIRREISQTGKAKFIDSIAYLLMGIFYSLLCAFLISMAWVAFIAVWYAIYMKDKTENTVPLKLFQVWSELKSKNNNQPLMSIVFLLFLGSIAFNPGNLTGKMFKIVISTAKKPDPSNKIELIVKDSLQVEPNTNTNTDTIAKTAEVSYSEQPVENQNFSDNINIDTEENNPEPAD